MNLLEKFIQHLKSFPFVNKHEKQLLAVSGGVDSIVLCDLMYHAGYDFIIAHCNFQLRGAESERDERFVIALAAKYEKQCLVKRFDTEKYAAAHKLSIQVAARDLRYAWFREMIEANREQQTVNHEKSETTNGQPETINDKPETSNNKRATTNEQQQTRINKQESTNEQPLTSNQTYILTAHHADDNIETVAMNFFRGTGLKGLTGMEHETGKVCRPMLHIRRQQIMAYATAGNLSYVEDSSNADSYYTRNYFRNELLPAVSKIFPQAEDNILKNIERLSDAALLYNEAIKRHIARLIEPKGNEEHIPILKLQKQVAYKTLLWEIISARSFTAAQTGEVIKLIQADNGSYIESNTHRIIKNRRWLIIAPLQPQVNNAHIVVATGDHTVVFAAGQLHLQHSIPADKFTLSPDKHIAAIDADKVTFPLLLRKWKKGDYFYPLGMNKKKKVSRFLIDQKLSATQKEKVWILESDKKIIWIIDQRIDDRCKIVAATKAVLKITFLPDSANK